MKAPTTKAMKAPAAKAAEAAPAQPDKSAKAARKPAKPVKAAKPVKPAKLPKAPKTQKAPKAPKAVAPAPSADAPGAPPADAASPAKPPKHKLVRDSFTIPRTEYQVLEALKHRLVELRRPTKKSELLRAGIQLLASLADGPLIDAVRAVPSIKTGRPSRGKAG